MSSHPSSPPAEGNPSESVQRDADAVPTARRPYQRPTVLRLGSVRELTLGGTSGFAEGAGTFIMAM
jgi:hypothetical protein